MLVNMFIIMIVLMVPAILLMTGVIKGELWENIMLINPMQAAQEVISGGFESYEFTYKYYVSLGYIVFGGIATYIFLAIPKFQKYAVKQSGV